MNATKVGAKKTFEYRWADERITSPIEVSAPEYIDYLMNWVQSDILADEQLFPRTEEAHFPKKFVAVLKDKGVFRRLFRVFAHIYARHTKEVSLVGIDPQVWSSFKRFYWFVKEFKLVDDLDMEPLQAEINSILTEDGNEQLSNSNDSKGSNGSIGSIDSRSSSLNSNNSSVSIKAGGIFSIPGWSQSQSM